MALVTAIIIRHIDGLILIVTQTMASTILVFLLSTGSAIDLTFYASSSISSLFSQLTERTVNRRTPSTKPPGHTSDFP